MRWSPGAGTRRSTSGGGTEEIGETSAGTLVTRTMERLWGSWRRRLRELKLAEKAMVEEVMGVEARRSRGAVADDQSRGGLAPGCEASCGTYTDDGKIGTSRSVVTRNKIGNDRHQDHHQARGRERLGRYDARHQDRFSQRCLAGEGLLTKPPSILFDWTGAGRWTKHSTYYARNEKGQSRWSLFTPVSGFSLEDYESQELGGLTRLMTIYVDDILDY